MDAGEDAPGLHPGERPTPCLPAVRLGPDWRRLPIGKVQLGSAVGLGGQNDIAIVVKMQTSGPGPIIVTVRRPDGTEFEYTTRELRNVTGVPQEAYQGHVHSTASQVATMEAMAHRLRLCRARCGVWTLCILVRQGEEVHDQTYYRQGKAQPYGTSHQVYFPGCGVVKHVLGH